MAINISACWKPEPKCRLFKHAKGVETFCAERLHPFDSLIRILVPQERFFPSVCFFLYSWGGAPYTLRKVLEKWSTES